MAWLLTALDPAKDIRSDLGSRPVVPAIHAFAVEHPKEDLVRRVEHKENGCRLLFRVPSQRFEDKGAPDLREK
jgi:hypothetical protein